MVYEVTGIYPAPSFFGLEVEDGGNVRVRVLRDLLTDSLQLTLYQVCLSVTCNSQVSFLSCIFNLHFCVETGLSDVSPLYNAVFGKDYGVSCCSLIVRSLPWFMSHVNGTMDFQHGLLFPGSGTS